MGMFGDLYYNENRPKYLGLPLEAITQTANVLDQRYRAAKEGYDKLEVMAETVNVRDQDRVHVDNRINDMRTKIDEVAKSGRWEYATNSVQSLYKDFATDGLLQGSIKEKAKEDAYIAELTEDVKKGIYTQDQVDNMIKQSKMMSAKTLAYDKDGNIINKFVPVQAPKYIDIEDKILKIVTQITSHGSTLSEGISKYPGLEGYLQNVEVEGVTSAQLQDAVKKYVLSNPEVKAYIEWEAKSAAFNKFAKLDDNKNLVFDTPTPEDLVSLGLTVDNLGNVGQMVNGKNELIIFEDNKPLNINSNKDVLTTIWANQYRNTLVGAKLDFAGTFAYSNIKRQIIKDENYWFELEWARKKSEEVNTATTNRTTVENFSPKTVEGVQQDYNKAVASVAEARSELTKAREAGNERDVAFWNNELNTRLQNKANFETLINRVMPLEEKVKIQAESLFGGVGEDQTAIIMQDFFRYVDANPALKASLSAGIYGSFIPNLYARYTAGQKDYNTSKNKDRYTTPKKFTFADNELIIFQKFTAHSPAFQEFLQVNPTNIVKTSAASRSYSRYNKALSNQFNNTIEANMPSVDVSSFAIVNSNSQSYIDNVNKSYTDLLQTGTGFNSFSTVNNENLQEFLADTKFVDAKGNAVKVSLKDSKATLTGKAVDGKLGVNVDFRDEKGNEIYFANNKYKATKLFYPEQGGIKGEVNKIGEDLWKYGEAKDKMTGLTMMANANFPELSTIVPEWIEIKKAGDKDYRGFQTQYVNPQGVSIPIVIERVSPTTLRVKGTTGYYHSYGLDNLGQPKDNGTDFSSMQDVMTSLQIATMYSNTPNK